MENAILQANILHTQACHSGQREGGYMRVRLPYSMQTKAFTFLFVWLTFLLQSPAQSPYFSRYVGSSYLESSVFEIDLYNPSPRRVDISGYMIVSRQFVFLLPRGSRIPPSSRFSMAKKSGKGVSLEFSSMEDFLIRIPTPGEQGDYLALFDRNGNLVDGFYYASNRDVQFLPDRGELVTYQNKRVPFELPGERNRVWQFLRMLPDPAMAFIRQEKGWQVTSRLRNLRPVTAFEGAEASFVEGIVNLQVRTAFEENCRLHVVERSEDGQTFLPIGELEAIGGLTVPANYRFYDDEVKTNRRYFYRFKNVDRFGFEVTSRILEVRTDPFPEEFQMNVFLGGKGEVNLRFSSRKEQDVHIKLLDEQYREVDVLFDGKLSAQRPQLIKYNSALPVGKYYLIASTEKQRFWEEVYVGE
ncbi:MAG: hypothetical protein AAGI38_00370 [Bacteroidota bacterium]